MTTVTFDGAFQLKILTLAMRDAAFMQRVEGLIQPGYFDLETHSYLADLANRHFETYRTSPDSRIVIKTIKDAKGAGLLKDEFVDDLKPILVSVLSPVADLSNRDFYVDEVAKFARQRAMEAALEKSIDILEKGGDFAEIDASIKVAQAVGAREGTAARDYFDSVADRVKARVARLTAPMMRGITTGHHELDDLLYHKGWGRKELYILMGGAKAGKSTGLGHFALKAVEAGHKVLYTTHENSADVTMDRLDAAISGVFMRDVDTSAATITAAVADLHKNGGILKIEEFPAGEATVADIERVIDKYAAQGIQFDLLVCDYADELRASRRHTDERFALKEVYTAMRALGQRLNIAVLTATQTNRAGNKATTAVATDVGEDWSKMKIADGVLTINSSEDEKKSGLMRLHFALMRNSAQGMTVHCSIDRARMRFITKILKVV
jgi:replicative DNA helicase